MSLKYEPSSEHGGKMAVVMEQVDVLEVTLSLFFTLVTVLEGP